MDGRRVLAGQGEGVAGWVAWRMGSTACRLLMKKA
jgi:hypothetical protein